jgi:phage gpG-like protein
MSDSITITVSGPALDMARRASDRAGMMNAIAREMDLQNGYTIAHISKVRMRGNDGKPFPPEQHILGIRSANLVRSLWASEAEVNGSTVTGTIGSPVKYAAIHEFGGTVKRVQLAGSVRLRTDARGNLLRQGKNGKLAVFAKAEHKRAVTVAYDGGKRFEFTIPERAPIRSGIADRAAAYGQGIGAAIVNYCAKG